MAQIKVSDRTIDRIEAITGRKFTRGGDRLINEMIDLFQKRLGHE